MTAIDWIRRRSAPHWLGLYALLIAAWAALFILEGLRAEALSGLSGLDWVLALCGADAAVASLPGLWAMWALMSLAMMAPTFLPALATYDDLRRAGAANRWGFAALLAGYLTVWLGFALAGAAAQLALARAGQLDQLGRVQSLALTAVVLMFAGAYQFSPLKGACVRQCRNPLTFFMERWAPGAGRAYGMGLHLGILCLGCCWALMALGFVAGTMNLLWMGAAMVLMTLEKLPEIGEALTRPLGYGLLAAGLALGGMVAGGLV